MTAEGVERVALVGGSITGSGTRQTFLQQGYEEQGYEVTILNIAEWD